MRMCRYPVYFFLSTLLIFTGCEKKVTPIIQYQIFNEALHEIDPRLFGHFLERPSWGGEIGPEGALDENGKLRGDVIKKMHDLKIPVLRFPGGTDIDYIDWTDMIDNATGRKAPERPITQTRNGNRVSNRFGYDEFLVLCEQEKIEPILVLNLLDAFLKRKPLEDAANHAAAQVAYCNALVEKDLPGELEKWSQLRAQNGRQQPYHVPYFQLGNETWFFLQEDKVKNLNEPDLVAWYTKCVATYIQKIKAVDPDVKIIVDYFQDEKFKLFYEQLNSQIDFVVVHHYMPWAIKEILEDTTAVDIQQLSEADIWNAWVSVPQHFNHRGESILYGRQADGRTTLDLIRKNGVPCAITEWNWNGWWQITGETDLFTPKLAQGLGAAGYLHAFMREGDIIKMACQSMLVGISWDITGIRVENNSAIPAYYYPTGQVVGFYSQNHGNRYLKTEGLNIPTYSQPYRMNGLLPQSKVATLDAVATTDDNFIYFHVINRDFSNDWDIRIQLENFEISDPAGEQLVFSGRMSTKPQPGESHEIGIISKSTVQIENRFLDIRLPKHSISIIKIPIDKN
ncbi:hypothetical protein JW964_15825 [candidate division KSB1 bacterium]|nr:hypothetical protein [candidate division KSB1 bacterium]